MLVEMNLTQFYQIFPSQAGAIRDFKWPPPPARTDYQLQSPSLPGRRTSMQAEDPRRHSLPQASDRPAPTLSADGDPGDLIDDVAHITLDRPERLNAMSVGLLAAFAEALDRAEQDGARAVLITGTGRAFCSGADLIEAASMTRDDPAFVLEEYYNPLARRLMRFPVPLVMADGALGLIRRAARTASVSTFDHMLIEELAMLRQTERTKDVVNAIAGFTRNETVKFIGR